MPKLQCPCGFVHDLTPIPDDGWLTLPDREYEQIMDAEQQRSLLHSAKPGTREWERLGIADRQVIQPVRHLYECPQCGRLMWQDPWGAEPRGYRVYRPDE
jgi:hypothetical protein